MIKQNQPSTPSARTNPVAKPKKGKGGGDIYGVVGGHGNFHFIAEDSPAINPNSPPPAQNPVNSPADHNTPSPSVTGDSYRTVNNGTVGGHNNAHLDEAIATPEQLREIRRMQDERADNNWDRRDSYKEVNGGIVGGDGNIVVKKKKKKREP